MSEVLDDYDDAARRYMRGAGAAEPEVIGMVSFCITYTVKHNNRTDLIQSLASILNSDQKFRDLDGT